MNTHVVGGEIRRALMGPFVLLLLLGGCVAAIYWVAMGRKPKERLTGCGSSFINPLMERWAGEYREQRVQIDYTVSGSGDGLRKLVEGKTDFACADILDAGQRKELVGAGKVLCVPLTIGAVVPVYNLPGVKQPLRFSGPVLAEIYLGKI